MTVALLDVLLVAVLVAVDLDVVVLALVVLALVVLALVVLALVVLALVVLVFDVPLEVDDVPLDDVPRVADVRSRLSDAFVDVFDVVDVFDAFDVFDVFDVAVVPLVVVVVDVGAVVVVVLPVAAPADGAATTKYPPVAINPAAPKLTTPGNRWRSFRVPGVLPRGSRVCRLALGSCRPSIRLSFSVIAHDLCTSLHRWLAGRRATTTDASRSPPRPSASPNMVVCGASLPPLRLPVRDPSTPAGRHFFVLASVLPLKDAIGRGGPTALQPASRQSGRVPGRPQGAAR